MRFNKQELTTLATQPSHKFDKEGVLFLRERQEGFFRRTEISLERWCRLRGNLLFYFKSRDQWSEPVGVIVLEQCSIRVDAPAPDGPYGFHLVFDGGASQHLAARSEPERDAWLQAVQLAGYECMRSQLLALQQRLERRRGHRPDLDVRMWRLRKGSSLDPSEVPLCEVTLSCDNLLCDGNGRPPNPVLIVHVCLQPDGVWAEYARTEVVQRSSNPSFLSTVSFRASDGLGADSRLRVTALDVRERVSRTAAPVGSAAVALGAVLDAGRLRVPLRSGAGTTVGFLSLAAWDLEPEGGGGSTESTPSRGAPAVMCHRRSQSLPPRLNARLKLPHQGQLAALFANPHLQTYHFHSGLGGDICAHELMAESRLCFRFPQQLLDVWIHEEKELLQEVAGMGEMTAPWHARQVELLDRHLHLLHLYSQARENLQAHRGSFFKPSSRKNDRVLEFAPVNLHLQRLWVQNETLRKSSFYDVVTVGAFTAHSHKSKNGGLIRLLQQLKESPMKNSAYQRPNKIAMAQDAIQAIKQLRREVVDGMRALMKLAKDKQTAGMLPICEDMISKTRILLSLWDPGLVEEALLFVDEHKVAQTPADDGGDGGDDSEGDGPCRGQTAVSPFKRITQRLNLELRSPDPDDLATPDTPWCTQSFWSLPGGTEPAVPLREGGLGESPVHDNQFVIFPEAEDDWKGGEGDANANNNNEEDEPTTTTTTTCSNNNVDRDPGRRFLDTQAMCSSPSANYYKPTDEPEPWDLIQLNIEASVMCLVSKVKFLCGRCGSPAVRLRSRGSRVGGGEAAVVTLQPVSDPPLPADAPLTADMSSDEVIGKTVDSVRRAVTSAAARNKFTEGLDFASIADWTCELRPSMRKLRHAMDGLLKTARLTHSAFRLQEDGRAAQRACNVRYRRDVCFSQALTSLVTGLMAKLWCQKPDAAFLSVLTALGPLASFEGLLSYYGDEVDMWGDMAVAVEDLATVTFSLVRCSAKNNRSPSPCAEPTPRVRGSRATLTVLLPVPDAVHHLVPPSAASFRVTPVFFNVGVNEMASLAESLGATRPQEDSNLDNCERLGQYYHRFRRLDLPPEPPGHRGPACGPLQPSLADLVDRLKGAVRSRQSKNTEVLHLSAHICRRMKGLRFTSCKSAKDRTGMSVTLEQCQVLQGEYDLAEHEFQRALDCMRSEGCRRENACKNTGVRKYAFNSLQLLTLPKLYRPPAGTYGSVQT
ncbi:inositol polyphosphate-4-phosphatase type I A isoform X2 [Bacillus rossius redtenbacheri]|uniref:inositol polyphosphate-4-phosphatase type I A isoform X2 n=1 Tax=Bacillus rossius redtenbacheri TaxID=93214 RepID=UPI002FDDE504